MIQCVLMIGLDGAGSFLRAANTPRIDELMARGAKTYLGRTTFPSISAEAWGAMLLGVTAQTHGLTNEIIGDEKNARFGEQRCPSVFAHVRAHRPDACLGSFCEFSSINTGILEHDRGIVMGRGDTDAITASVCDFFAKQTPTLVYAHYDLADHAGHHSGYQSREQLEAIETLDTEVGKIVDCLKANGRFEETLFIVCSDHGGNDAHMHGGDTDAEMNIFIGIAGEGVRPVSLDGMKIWDLPFVVAHALRIENADTWQGTLPEGLFDA